MTTKLLRFKVENFRSIDDSGWIEASDINCLVGTNESGKTNLLLALWKLKPANREPVKPLEDYPRKKYAANKDTLGKEVFITCEFELSFDTTIKLEYLTGWNKSIFNKITLSRLYNEKYSYNYSNNVDFIFSKEKLLLLLAEAKDEECEDKQDDDFNSINLTEYSDYLCEAELTEIYDKLGQYNCHNKEREIINSLIESLNNKHIPLTQEYFKYLLQSIPTFVYYSDYGNLDSEIYLPHVIKNIQRHDLGEKERAKTRSLKVLFEFVNLSPEEILELGKEALPTKVINKYNNHQTSTAIEEPKDEDIEQVRANKKEREILLQSASTQLTFDFRTWWKQGNYRFRLQADGNHFRIWVSDDIRTEEVELEGRSRGL